MTIKAVKAKIGADPGISAAILDDPIDKAIGKAIFNTNVLDLPEFWLCL